MYMIHPSNAPASDFPENKSSDFTLSLFETLLTPFSENWRVGLMQVQIPITFYNIESQEIKVFYFDNTQTVYKLPDGIYDNPIKITDILESVVEDGSLSLTWGNNRFLLELNNTVESVDISPPLARLLALPEKIKGLSGITHSPTMTFTPWVNHRVLLIHCNLVSEGQVNTKQYKILQSVIPSDFKFGTVFSQNFSPIDFLEVQGECQTMVNFKVTDLENNSIKFRSGNVVLTLAFKNDRAGS